MMRVRFAPSPTGYLHVGGARTALYNWLLARKLKGTFILRIEDTDELRSSDDSVRQIFDSLRWLGLDWDEGPLDGGEGASGRGGEKKRWASKGNFGPYFQMERQEIYRKYSQELLTKGALYECFCTEEELQAHRDQALLAKRAPRYSKLCRRLSEKEKESFRAQGRAPTLRFAVPEEGQTVFDDSIRDRVSFSNLELEDFIVVKSSGGPTYNFACVVDDHLMEITHVIRGEDHISNTPKQILIFQAIGWPAPQYAHLSILLGPDGSRLSKRHGATSILEFKDQGYLSQAVVNYLALLGWATQDSQDLFAHEELIAKFELERCQKNPAAFDYAKLQWMNGIYIRKLTKSQLLAAVRPFLGPVPANLEPILEEIVALEQEKYRTFAEARDLLGFFFNDNFDYRWEDIEGLMAKSLNLKTRADLDRVLAELAKRLGGLADFSVAGVEVSLRALAKDFGWKNTEVFHPLRFAVSGKLQGPSLFHMIALLGRDWTLGRVARLAGLKNSLAGAPIQE
ncbi:MAG: glutamate--tRNA ligase [Elusimicrobiota bacterium]